MIRRNIETELQTLIQQYPVVTITGPRQSGKTTLTRQVLKEFNYCNLENPETRELAINDPNAFFTLYKTPLIIDEVQRAPDLLSYIQVKVDEMGRMGMFVLTGSHQLRLNAAITQSLAGRTALLNLLPLSIHELINHGISLTRDEFLYTGFLPRIYDQQQNPTKALRNYFQAYIEWDVRQLINLKNLTLFENFLKMLAGRIGHLLNLNDISNDLGVSSTTLAEWISILEASYIVIRLQPYYENLGKRLIKSPKIYFTDVGLASYLIGIENTGQIARDPLLGNLFENMVVMEAFKTRYNLGMDTNLYFFRDHNKNEVDLLYKKGRDLTPIEIKAAMTYTESLTKGIRYFQKLKQSEGDLIYSGELEFSINGINILNFQNTHQIFSD